MKKILLTAFTVLSFVAINAQVTANTSQTVTINLSNVIDISVLGTPTGTDFTFNTVSDYSTGLTNTSASSFRVQSNKAWTVTVAAAAANFSSASATPMPANKLSVKLNGGGSFGALSTTAANLTSGAKGVQTFAVDYNANPGLNYDAGAYTLSVVYTATQQ